MNCLIILPLVSIGLLGCSSAPMDNDKNIETYQKCENAGMSATMNDYGYLYCVPPELSPHFKDRHTK